MCKIGVEWHLQFFFLTCIFCELLQLLLLHGFQKFLCTKVNISFDSMVHWLPEVLACNPHWSFPNCPHSGPAAMSVPQGILNGHISEGPSKARIQLAGSFQSSRQALSWQRGDSGDDTTPRLCAHQRPCSPPGLDGWPTALTMSPLGSATAYSSSSHWNSEFLPSSPQ